MSLNFNVFIWGGYREKICFHILHIGKEMVSCFMLKFHVHPKVTIAAITFAHFAHWKRLKLGMSFMLISLVHFQITITANMFSHLTHLAHWNICFHILHKVENRNASLGYQRLSILNHILSIQNLQLEFSFTIYLVIFLYNLFSYFEYYELNGNCVFCFMVCSQILRHVYILGASVGFNEMCVY